MTRFQLPAYSDLAKEHRGIGRTEGIAEGRVEGRAVGRAEGKAEALLITLEARGLIVSPEQRAHIEASQDSAQLDRWIRRALNAETTAEVLDV